MALTGVKKGMLHSDLYLIPLKWYFRVALMERDCLIYFCSASVWTI